MTKNKKGYILWWIAILLFIFFTHLNHPINSDEGVVLDGAWNLYNNKNLYLDFFEFIPPGSFYLILIVWKIFGVSFWSVKIFSILITFGTAIGIYFIARAIKPSRYNILAAGVFALASSFLWLINHNIYNLFFTVWAIYLMFLALDKQALKYYFFSGLMSGAAIMFLQQRGLALSGALFLFLLVDNWRFWKKWSVYGLGVLLPLAALLFWPVKIIYYDLLVFPFFNYIEANRISPIRLIIAFFIFIVIIYFFRKNKDKKIWLLFTAQFFLLLTTIPLPDYYHLVIALAPLLALIGTGIIKIGSEKSLYVKLADYYLLCLILTLFSSLSFFYLITVYAPSFSRENNKIFNIISEQCPGKYIYAGPFIPNLYFETGKLSATPYPFLMTGQNTPAQFKEAARYLEKRQPSCAVLAYPDSLLRFRYNKDNPVENYIREKYRLIYSDSTVFIYSNH